VYPKMTAPLRRGFFIDGPLVQLVLVEEQHDQEPFRWHAPQILSVKALSLTAVGLEVVAECVHRSTKLKSLKDVEALARFVFDGLPPICASMFYDLRPKWEK
jgi:hypothetical protein